MPGINCLHKIAALKDKTLTTANIVNCRFNYSMSFLQGEAVKVKDIFLFRLLKVDKVSLWQKNFENRKH